eukprot:3242238-Amphidinium_carterae.1
MTGCLGRPLAHAHARHIRMLATQSGAVQWHVEVAVNGGVDEYLSEVALMLENVAMVQEVGLKTRTRVSHPNEAEKKEENTIAELTVEYWRSLLAIDFLSMLQYTERPPFMFAALLHTDASSKNACLARCQVLFQVMSEAEASAESYVRGYLLDLLWPRSQLSRHVLVALWEAEFKEVPADIEKLLRDFFRGFGGSHICEEGFQHLQHEVQRSPSGVMARSTRWHKLCHSSLLPDHDRPHCPVERGLNPVAQKLEFRDSLFDGSSEESSLGGSALDATLVSPPNELRKDKTFGVTQYNQVPLRTATLVDFAGNLPSIELCFLTLLLEPGW